MEAINAAEYLESLARELRNQPSSANVIGEYGPIDELTVRFVRRTCWGQATVLSVGTVEFPRESTEGSERKLNDG